MLPVTKIQHFCTKDGPGVRTTVFLKGCPLRCEWCHNPETQSASAEFFYSDTLCIRCGACEGVCASHAHHLTDTEHRVDRSACIGCMHCADICPTGALERCSRPLSADAVFREVMKDAAFYGTGGGVTFSGGEPTVHAEQLIPLLMRFRRCNIHTAVETCGYFDPSILPALADATDLFLWDIKDTDNDRHRQNTGVSNERILHNLAAADAYGAKTVLRCILLSSVNIDTAHLNGIAAVYHSLKHCEGVELLPYHTYGASKSIQLGMQDPARRDRIPSEEEIGNAAAFLQHQHIPLLHR